MHINMEKAYRVSRLTLDFSVLVYDYDYQHYPKS